MPLEYRDEDFGPYAPTPSAGFAGVARTGTATPEGAASALRSAPLSPIPPDVGMHTPGDMEAQALQGTQRTVMAANPAVARWAATAQPAHVAVTKDDFPALGKIAQWFRTDSNFPQPVQDVFHVADMLDKGIRGSFDQYVGSLGRHPLLPSKPSDLLPDWKQISAGLSTVLGAASVPFALATAPLTEPAARAIAPNLTHTFPLLPWEQPRALTSREDQLNEARNIVNTAITAVAGGSALGKLFKGGSAPSGKGGGAAPEGRTAGPDAGPPPDYPAIIAAHDVEQIAKVQEDVAASQTHTRSPATAQQFLAQQTDHVVQVDPDTIIELQQQGHDPFPDHREEVIQAVRAGEPLEVPLSTYLAETAGKPWAEGVNKATVFRPGGVSVEEGSPPLTTLDDLGFKTDVPNEEWLASKVRRAEEEMGRYKGTSGATTGYFRNRPFGLPVEDLAKLPGAMDEMPAPGNGKYDELLESMTARGYDNTNPILIRVNHRGEPYILEGNNRVAVADRLGIKSIPVEISYVNGGERVEGVLSPAKVLEMVNRGKGPKVPERTERPLPEDITPTEAPRARYLAVESESAVERVVAEQRLRELFVDQKALGMTKDQFARYNEGVEAAISRATDRMLERAYTSIRAERLEPFKEAVAQHSAEVEQELAQFPAIRARAYLAQGKGPLGEPLESPLKLRTGDDIAAFGRDLGLPKSMFSREGGAADEVAELLGYQSGADLMRDLAGLHELQGERTIAAHMKELIREAAVERARGELGYTADREALRLAASELVQSPEITNFLADHLQEFAKANNIPFNKDVLKAEAVARFQTRTVHEATNIRQLEEFLRKDSLKVEKALLKGDVAGAFRWKQEQLRHQIELVQAHKFAKVYAKAGRNIKRWAKKKAISGLSQPYLDRIKQVLQAYDIPINRESAEFARAVGDQTLPEWVQSRRDLGQDITLPLIPAGNLRDLSVEQFTELNEALTAIHSYGKAEEQVVVNGRRVAMEVARSEAFASTQALPSRPVDLDLVPRDKWGKTVGTRLEQLDAEHVVVESFARYLDGGKPGIFTRVLTQGSSEAANIFDRLERQVLLPIIESVKGIPASLRRTYNVKVDNPIFRGPDGTLLTVHRGDIIPILANMGTESNAAKLAEGYGATVEEIHAWLDRYVTAEEAKFVQGMWDKLSKDVFPLADGVARNMRGYGMTMLPARALTVNGHTLRGGYWPVQYNPALVRRQVGAPNVDIPNEMEKATPHPFSVLTTPSGHELGRTAYVGPVDLSLDKVLQSHLRDVFTRIAYAEFAQSARRFITDKTIRAIVEDKGGPALYAQLMPWLEDQVMAGQRYNAPAKWAVRTLTNLRQKYTISVLAFNYSVGIKQALGLLPATKELNLRWMASGMVNFYTRAATGRLGSHPIARSEEMRYRFDALDVNLRELRDGFNSIDFNKPTAKALFERLQQAGMAYIGFMDKYTVSGATWTGAWQKAKYRFKYSDADALQYADQMVRRTQGAGRHKDLVGVQRSKDEAVKTLAMMFTWPGRQYNLIRDAANEIRTGKWVSGSYNLFWLMVIAPFATAWANGDMPDKDADAGEWLKFIALMPVRTLGESTILTRDIVGGAVDKLTKGHGFGPRAPLAALYEKLDRAVLNPLISKSHKITASAWIDILGTFYGTPGTAQAAKAARFVESKKPRSRQPTSALDWYEGLTHGPARKDK